MSTYKFRAVAVENIDASSGGRFIYVTLDMDTPQAKEAFLNIAGDCRGSELTDWIFELGYHLTDIDPGPTDITDYTMRQGELGNPDRSR
jgi:hypothetical protein